MRARCPGRRQSREASLTCQELGKKSAKSLVSGGREKTGRDRRGGSVQKGKKGRGIWVAARTKKTVEREAGKGKTVS